MIRRYICCLIALFCIGTLTAQTLSQAKKLFNNGNYEKAKNTFQNLVKRSPASAEYNFYFGACCYETGEKEKALPYLEKSANRRYINAYRYLGKLYADMYRFDEAIENYETHIEWLVEKNRDTEQAEAELSEIRKMARMFKGVEKVVVIDSFVVNKQDFLTTIKISKESGTIGQADDIAGTFYINELGNKKLYTDSIEGGKMQLYSQGKLLNGWEEAVEVSSLNELGSINYPFLMGDGVTLYFASDNETSMGGYDIFVTRYDSEDNNYLRPDNLGMPFNSPANDYMYAIDEFNNLGWFVSDRNQPQDTVCVYVFVPNESKEVYNYETTDAQIIQKAATIHSIQDTWTDEEKVRTGRQRLAGLKYHIGKEGPTKDFEFIIDDSSTYYTLTDFRSQEAKEAYRQLMQQEKDLKHLKQTLQQKRYEYTNENGLGKKKLEPSILDLEKRIPTLEKEIEQLTIKVRNLEIQKLRQ